MEISAEALIEAQKPADAERGEEKRDRKAGGIHGEQEHAARDGVARRSEREHRCKNRSDARRPTESEGKTEKKAAPDAGLRSALAQMDVAIQPTGHRRTEETNQREREKVNRAESGEERSAKPKRGDP